MSYYKTDPSMFGVWKVKQKRNVFLYGRDTGVRYFETESEAWESLKERASHELIEAQKNLDKAHRNHVKTLANLQRLNK